MSQGNQHGEFYIGYLPRAPAGTARFLRPFVIAAVLGVFAVSLALGLRQEEMDRGDFEFGVERSYQGTLSAGPIPILHTAYRVYILVGDGKFGAGPWAEKWASEAKGHEVMLRGTLIQRKPLAMLEVDRQSHPKILPSVAAPVNQLATQTIGDVELQGELVDTKCYLGVMRPAVGKGHRACAIRCLSGGVPPGILIRNQRIDTSVMILLEGTDGKPNVVSAQWAGRTIQAQGRLAIRGGLPVLEVHELGLSLR